MTREIVTPYDCYPCRDTGIDVWNSRPCQTCWRGSILAEEAQRVLTKQPYRLKDEESPEETPVYIAGGGI